LQEFTEFNEEVGKTLSLYCESIRQSTGWTETEKFEALGEIFLTIDELTPEQRKNDVAVRLAFKKLSEKHTLSVSKVGMSLRGTETMFGYRRDPYGTEDFFKLVSSWCLGPNNISFTTIEQDDALEAAIKMNADKLWAKQSGMIDFDLQDYLKPGMYFSRGSARGFTFAGKRASKTQVLAEMSSDALYQYLMDTTPVVLNAVQKQETVKKRSITNTDISLYLQMAMLGKIIDKYGDYEALGVWPKFSLHKRIELMRAYSSILQTHSATFVPYDQSQFDHNISLVQVLMSFVALFERPIFPKFIVDLSKRIRHRLMSSFMSLSGLILFVINGVMSGWFFTSFIDSFMNLCQLLAIYLLSRIETKLTVAQGDDINTVVADVDAANALLEWLKSAGLNIAADKTKVSSDSFDWLRTVYTVDGICGFPARAVSGLLYKKPWLETTYEAELKGWSSEFSSFIRFYRRINFTPDAQNAYLIDLAKKMLFNSYKLPNKMIDKVLAMPQYLGGLELIHDTTSGAYKMELKIKTEKLKLSESGTLEVDRLSTSFFTDHGFSKLDVSKALKISMGLNIDAKSVPEEILNKAVEFRISSTADIKQTEYLNTHYLSEVINAVIKMIGNNEKLSSYDYGALTLGDPDVTHTYARNFADRAFHKKIHELSKTELSILAGKMRDVHCALFGGQKDKVFIVKTVGELKWLTAEVSISSPIVGEPLTTSALKGVVETVIGRIALTDGSINDSLVLALRHLLFNLYNNLDIVRLIYRNSNIVNLSY